MNFSKILVTALVALAFNASAAPTPPAAPAPVIKLGSVTGTVQIKTPNGGTLNVKAGDPAIEIPAGSQVIVLTGAAVVESGGVIVKAGAGDTFTVNAGEGGVIGVAVSAGGVSVTDSSGKTVEVQKGEVSTTRFVAPPAAKPAAKSDAAKTDAPESIPATGTTASSPVQETVVTVQNSCTSTVSPSAPCN